MINTSNITGSTGFIELMVSINIASGGLFGFFVWLSPYILLTIIFFKFGVKAAVSSACYVGVVLSLLLRLMNLINDTLLFTSIVLMVGISIILWLDK